jgi:Flp pilus assembly protein TadG
MKSRAILKNNLGASAVEFAIILPLLLVFIFGIIEWSLYLYNDHVITNASREGARRGIVAASPRPTEAEITAAVLSYTAGNLVTFGSDVPSISPITICSAGGDDLTITVNYNYTFLILPALTLGAVPEFIAITANTIMRCE